MMFLAFFGGSFLGAGYALLAYRYHRMLVDAPQSTALLILSSLARVLVMGALIALVFYAADWWRTAALLGIVGGYVATMLWCHRRS